MIGYHYLGGGNIKFRAFFDEPVAQREDPLVDTKNGIT
jgi:hypothetical protein